MKHELREDGNDEEEILQHHTSSVGKREWRYVL
jgi:hypothetical protein